MPALADKSLSKREAWVVHHELFLRGRATQLMLIAINSIAGACSQIVSRKFLTGCASYFIQDSSRDDVIAHYEENFNDDEQDT